MESLKEGVKVFFFPFALFCYFQGIFKVHVIYIYVYTHTHTHIYFKLAQLHQIETKLPKYWIWNILVCINTFSLWLSWYF